VLAHLALPLRSRGFGLEFTTPLEADAAFLAAAGAADVAMRPTPRPSRPFKPSSTHCAALIAWWAVLHGAVPGLWSPELQALDAPLLAPVLLHAQRENGRHLADRRFAGLLVSAPPSFEGTRFRARLDSRACQPASIWLDTMPTSFPLTLSNSDFTSCARLHLGLPAGPASALWCERGTTILLGASDHPLTCTCLGLQQTSRHDFVTKKAPFCCSGGRPNQSGIPLPLLPDAPALAQVAAPGMPDNPAPSPGPGAPFRSLHPPGVPSPLGPGAEGDIIVSFRAGLWWMRFLSSTWRPRPLLGELRAARVCGWCPGRVQAVLVSAGVFHPALCAHVGRVLRAPCGPGPDSSRGLG
jgi:hypothetical protein